MSDKNKIKKYDYGSHGRLTARQKIVLEYLVGFCGEEVKTITHKMVEASLKMVDASLEISKRGVRVHLDALVKKKLISSDVACRKKSGQPIGRRIRITKDGETVLFLAINNETLEQISDILKGHSLCQLSEAESRYIRERAIQEIKEETGWFQEEPSDLRIAIYIKDNLLGFVWDIKFIRYVRTNLAHWSDIPSSVPNVITGLAGNNDVVDDRERDIGYQKNYVYKTPEDILTWSGLAFMYKDMDSDQFNVMELHEHLKNHDDPEMANDFLNKVVKPMFSSNPTDL